MLEPHKPNLHGEQHPQHIHAVIRHIQPQRVPSRHKQHQHIKRHQVDYKHITPPRRHHVEVPERRAQGPRQWPGVHRLHKEVKSQQQREDRDALVVVGSGDGAGDVAGADRDERGGDDAGAGVPDLFREEVSDEGGVGGEEGRGEDADLADVDEEAEEAEEGVDGGGGEHEAGVEGAADNAAERVPWLRVEPVPELGEAVACEEERGAVVEVGVELVDHGLVAENAEEARDEGEDVDEGERGDAYQKLLLLCFEL